MTAPSKLQRFDTWLKSHWADLCFALLIYASLFCSADCLFMGSTGSGTISIVRTAICAAIAILVLTLGLWKRREQTLARLPKVAGFFLLFCVLLFFSWICNIRFAYYESVSTLIGSLEYKYVLDLVNLLLALSIACVIDFRFYFRHLSFFLVASCICGILLFGTKNFLPGLFHRLPSFVNDAGYTVYFGGLAFGFDSLNRLTGFAREPGVFAVYLIIALGYELFASNSKFKWRLVRIAVLLVGLGLGQSTGGFVAIVPLFLAFLMQKNISVKTRLFISAAAIVFIGILSPWVLAPMFGKIASTSFGSRFFSFPVCLQMWLRNPAFGIGWGQSNEFILLYSSEWQSSDMHITNTPLFYAAVHGLFYAALICIGAGLLIRTLCLQKQNNSKLTYVFLGLAVLLVFLNENLTNSAFPLVIAFFGLRHAPIPEPVKQSKAVRTYSKLWSKIIHANYRRILPIVLSISGSIVSFALTFFLSRNLGGEIYGNISYCVGLLSVFSLFIQAGLPNFVIKNAQFAQNPKTFLGKCMLLSSIVFLCGFPIFYAICFFALGTNLTTITIVLMAFAALFEAAIAIVCHFLMSINKKSLSSIIHTLLPKAFMLVIAVIFMLVGRLQNWYGEHYLEIFIAAYFISLAPTLVIYMRLSKIRFSKAELISIGLFFLIAVTSSVSSQIAKVFQREFMNKSMVSVGALGVCAQVSSILSVLSTAITNVYRPDMARLYAEGKKAEAFSVYRKITLLLSCFSIPFGAGILVQSSFIISLFSSDYSPYYWIMLYVVGGGVLNALLGPINALLVSTGFEKYSLINAIADLVVFVGLSLALGPFFEWGIVFALAGGIVAECMMKIIECVFVYHRSPFSLSALIVIAIIGAISLGVFYGVSLIPSELLKIMFDLIAGVLLITLFYAFYTIASHRKRKGIPS